MKHVRRVRRFVVGYLIFGTAMSLYRLAAFTATGERR